MTEPRRLTPEIAEALVAEALAEARRRALRPMGVAVLDSGGHLIAFRREDLGAALRLQIALGKASGALALGMSSRALVAVSEAYPTLIPKLDTLAMAGFIAAPGALLIDDGEGGVMAAIAATGDSGDNDEACARAAIKAVGLTERA